MDSTDASPEATAQRELREETGYDGVNPQLIGRIYPNPAIMSNTCFTVLIENCRCAHPVEFDSGEDLLTRLTTPEKPEVMRFPPLFARKHYMALDHIETFPNLMGSVHSQMCRYRWDLTLTKSGQIPFNV